MAVFSSILSDEEQAQSNSGVIVDRVTVSVPTTALDSADEQVLLYQFANSPFGGEVWLLGATLTLDDLDSGATPSLSADIGIGDSDGVVDTALVSGDTTGQAGGTVVAQDPGADVPVDVSGKFLIYDVTAAANAAQAGDIEVFVTLANGVLSKTATVA